MSLFAALQGLSETFSRGGMALHGKPAVSADASGRKPLGQIAVELGEARKPDQGGLCGLG